MNEQNPLCLAFIISILSTLVISTWFIYNIIGDISLFFSHTIYQMLLIIICVCFVLSAIFFRKLLTEVRYEVDNRKEKERNIRDIYLYNQLLDPPSTNN